LVHEQIHSLKKGKVDITQNKRQNRPGPFEKKLWGKGWERVSLKERGRNRLISRMERKNEGDCFSGGKGGFLGGGLMNT